MTNAIYLMSSLVTMWGTGFGPKEYGISLLNKRGYSHKRTNKKAKKH